MFGGFAFGAEYFGGYPVITVTGFAASVYILLLDSGSYSGSLV